MAKRRDGQKSGLAGEFFVAAELLKREWQVAVTIGNAKAVDLFAQQDVDSPAIAIQVRTIREPRAFIIQSSDVNPCQVWVFVILGANDKPVRYFILSGQQLIDKRFELWGPEGGTLKFDGIPFKRLLPYENQWRVFGGMQDKDGLLIPQQPRPLTPGNPIIGVGTETNSQRCE